MMFSPTGWDETPLPVACQTVEGRGAPWGCASSSSLYLCVCLGSSRRRIPEIAGWWREWCTCVCAHLYVYLAGSRGDLFAVALLCHTFSYFVPLFALF